ncbi:MAG: zinc ribbon domain-containing protein [Spirochaetaceae bacterium]|jgi:hypothetical protein|nr:zinc ribbon domain-containing protein [Spirochaetaceae bacterium]
MGLLGGLVNAFLEGVAEEAGVTVGGAENDFAPQSGAGCSCPQCGKRLNSGAAFCSSCGARVSGSPRAEAGGGKQRNAPQAEPQETMASFTVKYQIIGRGGVVMNGIRYANVKAKNLYEAKNAFRFRFADSGTTKYKIVGVIRN